MPDLSRGIILRFMREAVKEMGDPSPRYSELMDRTMQKLLAAGLISKQVGASFAGLMNINPLAVLLTEGYQQLLAFGYVVPRANPPNGPTHDWFSITQMGRQWAEGTDPIPEDPGGYLAALEALVPQVDPVILQYVGEALNTYQHRALFASAVMVGAASEKTTYLLTDALHGSVKNPTDRKAIKDAAELRRLPAMFQLLSKQIERAKKSGMPYDVHEGAHTHLFSLQESIRVQRNDAVHPQVGQVGIETVRLSLAAFPAACKKVYDLIGWFSSNRF